MQTNNMNQFHPLDTHSESIEIDSSEINRDVLVKFKHIITQFIEGTAPKIKVKKLNGGVGYEAVISKDEAKLTSYSLDRLNHPISHTFKCKPLMLINQDTNQADPSFMFEFMRQYQNVFDDISTKKADVERLI